MNPLVGGDFCLVTLVGRANGQTLMNTFPYRCSTFSGTPTQDAALEALFNALTDENDLVDKFLDCLSSTYELKNVWLQIIRPTRRRKISYAMLDTGTYAAVMDTSNVQASITRFGADANRRNIGGIRLPMPTSPDAMQGGVIAVDYKEVLVLLASQMIQPVTTVGAVATWIPQVGVPAPSASPIPAVASVAQDTVRVLRRRTVGLGI